MACVKKGRLADLADNFQLSVYLETLRLFPPVRLRYPTGPGFIVVFAGIHGDQGGTRVHLDYCGKLIQQ